jgi:hypothetical protein
MNEISEEPGPKYSASRVAVHTNQKKTRETDNDDATNPEKEKKARASERCQAGNTSPRVMEWKNGKLRCLVVMLRNGMRGREVFPYRAVASFEVGFRRFQSLPLRLRIILAGRIFSCLSLNEL